MRLTDFLKDIGRPLVYYPSLSKITGGIKETIFLCNLTFWTGKQNDPEGWIRKSCNEIEEETGLTRREQDKARNTLKKEKLILERKRGTPATIEFLVEIEKINTLWERQIAQNEPSVAQKRQTDSSNWTISCTKTPNKLHKNAKLLNTSLTTSLLKNPTSENHHIVNNSENGEEKPLRAAFFEGREYEKPTEDQLKTITVLCATLSDTPFNPKQFLGKYIQAKIPPEVIIYVLGEIAKQQQSIKDYWAYGIAVLKRKFNEYEYDKQLEEHYRRKREPVNLKHIFSKGERA